MKNLEGKEKEFFPGIDTEDNLFAAAVLESRGVLFRIVMLD